MRTQSSEDDAVALHSDCFLVLGIRGAWGNWGLDVLSWQLGAHLLCALLHLGRV